MAQPAETGVQRSGRLKRLVWTALRVAVLMIVLPWVGFVVIMYAQRHDLLYRFDLWQSDARAVGGPGAVAELTASDGTPLAVWVAPPRDGRPVVLHFGGNAGVLRMAVRRTLPLIADGYGVVVMNYRGAGEMPGSPSQAAIVADALEVYDSLGVLTEDAGPPILYGASLGAAVAVQVAARRPARALVLAAPFARLCETAEHHYPWLPACMILTDERWSSADLIGDIDAPVLILHGARDRIIPLSQAQALHRAAGPSAQMVVYPRAGHRDLAQHGAETEILRFLASL